MDKTYRKQVCKDLRIPFTDEGYNQVLAHGGGSSFTGLAPVTDKKKYITRYKGFEGAPLYKEMITPELLELNKKLYE